MYRWWDGTAWTEAISESPHAPAPRADIEQILVDDPIGGELLDESPPRKKSPLVMAVAIGLALLLTTGVGFGYLSSIRTPTALQANPDPSAAAQSAASAEPGKAKTPSGQVDEVSGRVQIGSATMTLPGEPYRVYGQSVPIKDAFDIFFVANAPVHVGYDGKSDWSATVGLAHMPITASTEMESIGKDALDGITSRFFGSHPITLDKLTMSPVTVSDRPAARFTVEVHYDISQLKSSYDQLVVVVVRLSDDSLVAAISSVPNDADLGLHEQAAEALATLAIF